MLERSPAPSLPQLRAEFGTKRIELRVIGGAHCCIVGACVEHAEQEERGRRGEDGNDREEPTRNH